ncbi:hypothetical protein BGX16_2577 [Hallerella succinigenes]|uniref:Uncharacterized protein n=2 Tax=Fibrobacteraceae TaxID=204431 RepID=A0A2M9AA00_9BACT|nr:hypothetical protein [Hallerella succinigenes]PJJ42545.1 hypothetical protein BGX16_2577 [Hallerella succinigenes]
MVVFWMLLASSSSFAAMDAYDSMYVNTLNMSDAEAAAVYGVDSSKIEVKPTRQELQEEKEPEYVMRDYNHREQVIVGVSVMLCVALAMVMMNNYNPSR